jgi:hypothetical protein
MKVYQVEYRTVITVEADDLATAEMGATAFLKENPHVIRVIGIHEINRSEEAQHHPTHRFRPLGQSIAPIPIRISVSPPCSARHFYTDSAPGRVGHFAVRRRTWFYVPCFTKSSIESKRTSLDLHGLVSVCHVTSPVSPARPTAPAVLDKFYNIRREVPEPDKNKDTG